MQRITIDPLTRLEGHAKVEIFLDQAGEVAEAYFLVPELRGFEQLCVGRPAEEMPRITSRICGICPGAHHMASTKALDDLWGVEPTPAARRVRELYYAAFVIADHATHFFVLAGPDLFVGPEAPVAERSILGVLRKLGKDAGKQIIEARVRNFRVLELLGGRAIHPVAGLPGGWSQAISAEMQDELRVAARDNLSFAQFCLHLFEEAALRNQQFVELMLSDGATDPTYSMGTVDRRNRFAFYDGRIRVVDPDGVELAAFAARDYLQHIAERIEPWTYLKMPYLRQVGWHGLVAGKESGIYATAPLARLNAADGMPTPRAQELFERMYETLGSEKDGGRYRPIHHRMANHWARLIELLHAAERMIELADDPELTDPNVRVAVSGVPGRGVGHVEAPRGTLIHDYETDADGLLTRVNLIVGTTHNHAPIALSVRNAARSLIRAGRAPDEAILNRIEMVVRSYDPCISCASHTFPGGMPLRVTVRDAARRPVARIERQRPLS